MATRRIIYALSLLCCLMFFSAYQLWFSYFVLMAIIWLPWFSLVVSLPAIFTSRLELSAPRSLPLGTVHELSIFYGSRLPTPPWRCRLVVERPLTGQKWIMKDVEDLPTEHCGGLTCTIRKARVCDYLGLFALPMRKGEDVRCTVRPQPLPLADTNFEQYMTKAWKPKPGGGFAENHELRLYRPGDSVQQIHWKLSAKTGSLILREPMEPVRSKILLRLDLCGSPELLDRKLGNLLWLSQQLLVRDLHFQIQALTGTGVQSWSVTDEQTMLSAIDQLLFQPPATTGSLLDLPEPADWQYFIGGDAP